MKEASPPTSPASKPNPIKSVLTMKDKAICSVQEPPEMSTTVTTPVPSKLPILKMPKDSNKTKTITETPIRSNTKKAPMASQKPNTIKETTSPCRKMSDLHQPNVKKKRKANFCMINWSKWSLTKKTEPTSPQFETNAKTRTRTSSKLETSTISILNRTLSKNEHKPTVSKS